MSNCAYKAMGFPECHTTPHMLACSRCGRASAATGADVIAAIAPTIGADCGQDGRIILTGTPWSSREYMAQRVPPITESEQDRLFRERIRRHTEGVRDRMFASMMIPAKALRSGASGMALANGRDHQVATVRYTTGWYATDKVYDFPCSCGRTIRGTDRDRGKRCDHEPSTLREWLGDRVSELGRWAVVLKDHPPDTWAWRRDNTGGWFLQAPGATIPTTPRDVIGAVTWGQGPWPDTVQMALFTRHPDVKPYPRPAAYPWSPEDQHETIARDA